jgi:signal transduction histidine kinase/DNA-binding response OmpR family regulator
MQEDTGIDNRKAVLDYISDNPGAHLRKIARDLDIHLSTLRYHLDNLEKQGLIGCQKQNNLKVYFTSGKLKPIEKTLTPLLQQKRFRDIILVLIDYPGLTFSQIVEKLSIGTSTASKYINTLEDQKILFHEKSGREKKYYLSDEKSVVELLATYKQFMEDMSYEIRVPMNTIVGITSLLLDGKLTPEQRDFVEMIKVSGDALMSIINNILDFTKIERETITLDVQDFNLRDCVEEALDSVALMAAEKKLDLAYITDRNTPGSINGDRNRLRQILINLLNNAVKFTEKGEVLVSASSKRSGSLYEIHFTIKDTGIGVPQDEIDHLFESYGQAMDRLSESFSQADFESFSHASDPTTKKYTGKGLGLAISKKLVELMKGRIWAESKVGVGSSIHFTIMVDHVSSVLPLSGVQPLLQGKHILIVEANKTIGNILSLQAWDWGMIPVTVDSSHEAARLVQHGNPFDAVALDNDMPEIDGISLARTIRKYQKALPLLTLAFVDQRIEADLSDATLWKPVKLSELHNALISVFTARAEPLKEPLPISEETGPGSMRVLLAEDNVSNQKVTMTMLKRLGYSADLAANGKEALRALENQSYDLVLMDVRMPEMNGLEATRIIRQRWPEKGPKIIAITAFALQGDKEKCLAAGMDDYISKPVRMNELAKMLGKYQPHRNAIS